VLRSIPPDTTFVHASAAMTRVIELADRVAATPASSALILGESGVGKEVVATRIHERSHRRNEPFVRVNLAAIPDSMVEAEFFGSVRGSFTDSKRDRTGLFSSADGGTILLDELCEFKIEMQPKLLRVLEERRFYPVGSDRERRMDVRVLAATNRDVEEAIEQGLLRRDLFYRLGVMVIHVPPLRERLEDVLPLARHFLAGFAQEFARPALALTAGVEDVLLGHTWPGNVRELRNIMERAVMITDGREVQADAVAESIGSMGPPRESGKMLKADHSLEGARRRAVDVVEREHIERILKLAGGSRTRAAQMLDVSRTTLWEKLRYHKL